jgi:ectoine hydroxylase-related dioxygenase (phytanoyl-CoA dioxygenase family)
MADFLGVVFGDALICVGATYSRSDPGYPGMALHTDSHPYASNLQGRRSTSPVIVRALYYLDDLTPERSPLRVIPYSHLSLHHHAMPYMRYRSHPDEVRITCRASDAIVINNRIFHAAGANTSRGARRMVGVSYRPAWARPTLRASDYPASANALDPSLRALFKGPNHGLSDTNIVNWSDELPFGGIGLSPQRWSRT